MSRSFKYRDKNVWIRLYKTFVRPHLEFSVQAWSPWLLKDIEELERVQKRAVDMVIGLNGLSYEEKLKQVGLTSLAERRIRGDVIQVWKYIHSFSITTINNPVIQVVRDELHRKTRHTSKQLDLIKPNARLDVRKHFSVTSQSSRKNMTYSLQALKLSLSTVFCSSWISLLLHYCVP